MLLLIKDFRYLMKDKVFLSPFPSMKIIACSLDDKIFFAKYKPNKASLSLSKFLFKAYKLIFVTDKGIS